MIFPCFRKTGLSGIGEELVELTETLASRRAVWTGVTPALNLTLSPIIYVIANTLAQDTELKHTGYVLKARSLPLHTLVERTPLQSLFPVHVIPELTFHVAKCFLLAEAYQ